MFIVVVFKFIAFLVIASIFVYFSLPMFMCHSSWCHRLICACGILDPNRLYGPRRDKTCLRGFRKSETQTSLINYRDWLQNIFFACSKFKYDTFKYVNIKGADQSARMRMRRLVCAFVVRQPRRQVFSRRSPYLLRDFKNAPFYILCLFHMINLRMFSLSFLSSCKMDHDLPLF